MSYLALVRDGFRRVKGRIDELAARDRRHDQRLAGGERQWPVNRAVDVPSISPGSPVNHLVDLPIVQIIEDLGDDTYSAVRQVPSAHGEVTTDPDDGSTLKVRPLGDPKPKLRVGDVIYAKYDGQGAEPYYHAITTPAGGLRVLTLHAVHADHLTCRDGDENDVLVYKPWHLMTTPFDGQEFTDNGRTIRYVYDDELFGPGLYRELLDVGYSLYPQRETVMPPYIEPGDASGLPTSIILAAPISGADGVLPDVDEEALTLIDVTPRVWGAY